MANLYALLPSTTVCGRSGWQSLFSSRIYSQEPAELCFHTSMLLVGFFASLAYSITTFLNVYACLISRCIILLCFLYHSNEKKMNWSSRVVQVVWVNLSYLYFLAFGCRHVYVMHRYRMHVYDAGARILFSCSFRMAEQAGVLNSHSKAGLSMKIVNIKTKKHERNSIRNGKRFFWNLRILRTLQDSKWNVALKSS